MEKDDEFLYTYFNYLSQLGFDKAKDHLEKDKDSSQMPQTGVWCMLVGLLQQLIFAEKSYMEIGFLQTKNKGFLRKDNSLKSVYETMKSDMRRLEENCKQDRQIMNYSKNITDFLNARINLIDLYDKIYLMGTSKQLKYNEILTHIESIIERYSLGFTDISMTPVKAVFNFECEILQHSIKALIELQRLQFMSSLALINGMHTRIGAWENKMQRETWKLGFIKNNPAPMLFQWLQRLKGSILSKFSLYFHDVLAQQTTIGDMRQLCAKLQHDHYQRMINFLRKNDVTHILLITDGHAYCSDSTFDNLPVIVSYPKYPPHTEAVTEIISQNTSELNNPDRILFKFVTKEQNQFTYVITNIEPTVYFVLVFDSKKSEKDLYIINFISEFCSNLRCFKLFASLKSSSK